MSPAGHNLIHRVALPLIKFDRQSLTFELFLQHLAAIWKRVDVSVILNHSIRQIVKQFRDVGEAAITELWDTIHTCKD